MESVPIQAASAWFSSLPKGWAHSRIKYEVTRIGSGGTPNTDDDLLWARDGSGTAWVSIADMSTTDMVTTTERRLTAAGLASKNLETFPPGTLLYSMYASVGKISVLGVNAAINQAMLAILPDAKKIDARFFRWALQYVSGRILELASTNTQDNLNLQKVRNAFLLRPPMVVQIAIADFLDRETAEADALIAKYERLLKLLEEKRVALITQAVTKGLDPNVPMKDSGVEWIGEIPAHWTVSKAKYIAKMVVGIVIEPSQYFAVDGLPFLHGNNIGNGRLLLDTVKHITPADSMRNEKSMLNEGDLVTMRVGEPGRTAVVTKDCEGGNCASIILTKGSALFNAHWLRFAMSSEPTKFQIYLGQNGSAQQVLNVSDAMNLLLPLPSLAEQNVIAGRLLAEEARFDRLKQSLLDAIALVKERRSALITAAVTGQIDVTTYKSGTTMEVA